MKIALVHRYYPMQGGVTTVVDYLYRELSKMHQVEIITSVPSKERGIKIIEEKGIKFYFKAFRYIKDKNMEIIHTQSFPMCFFSPFTKIPIILSVQGYEKAYEKGHPPMYYLKTYYCSLLRIASYHFADSLIAISNVIKENLKNYLVNPKKIKVIHNGVDTEKFKPLELSREKNEIRIFHYGSTHRKGFYLLLNWAKEIVKECPEVKFVIAGEKKNLNQELSPHFEFHEDVPFKDMPRLFNSTDIVLMPSLMEPFGITAAEGMACGKPVIVSEFSGAKDVLNGRNGIISSFANFPQNILLLIKNKDLRKNMGQLARKTAEEELSSEKLTEQHINFYKSSIGKE